MRYLGQLYRQIKSALPKAIIMAEIAARSCKGLLRKAFMDISMASRQSNKEYETKIRNYINIAVGNTTETAQFWKMVSLHSQTYFGV